MKPNTIPVWSSFGQTHIDFSSFLHVGNESFTKPPQKKNTPRILSSMLICFCCSIPWVEMTDFHLRVSSRTWMRILFNKKKHVLEPRTPCWSPNEFQPENPQTIFRFVFVYLHHQFYVPQKLGFNITNQSKKLSHQPIQDFCPPALNVFHQPTPPKHLDLP